MNSTYDVLEEYLNDFQPMEDQTSIWSASSTGSKVTSPISLQSFDLPTQVRLKVIDIMGKKHSWLLPASKLNIEYLFGKCVTRWNLQGPIRMTYMDGNDMITIVEEADLQQAVLSGTVYCSYVNRRK